MYCYTWDEKRQSRGNCGHSSVTASTSSGYKITLIKTVSDGQLVSLSRFQKRVNLRGSVFKWSNTCQVSFGGGQHDHCVAFFIHLHFALLVCSYIACATLHLTALSLPSLNA